MVYFRAINYFFIIGVITLSTSISATECILDGYSKESVERAIFEKFKERGQYTNLKSDDINIQPPPESILPLFSKSQMKNNTLSIRDGKSDFYDHCKWEKSDDDLGYLILKNCKRRLVPSRISLEIDRKKVQNHHKEEFAPLHIDSLSLHSCDGKEREGKTIIQKKRRKAKAKIDQETNNVNLEIPKRPSHGSGSPSKDI